MPDDLRTRIAAVLYEDGQRPMDTAMRLADAVIRELNIPDRTHVDDQGRTWEWCGGQPGTWAWRITQNGPVDAVAAMIVSELDGEFLDFALWLSEELTGEPMSRIDAESCLADWRASENDYHPPTPRPVGYRYATEWEGTSE